MAYNVNKPTSLNGKTIAILVAEGFEQVEMTEPRKALEEAGAHTVLISPSGPSVRAWQHTEWGDTFRVDLVLDSANPEDYAGLLLPGGVMNPDHLRMNSKAVHFVRSFFESGKPIAAICHGPWMLAEADVIKGLSLTSYPSIRSDLLNAGAKWFDSEVVVDNGVVTSRKPDDIPAFNRKMIEEFAEGAHSRRERELAVA